MAVSSKRAEQVSIVSLVLSVVFFIVVLLLGRWSGFFAITAVSWLILSSVLVWFVLVIQFHQRALAEQEKLDMSQLGGAEKGATIFQAKGEQAALLAVAQRRLELLEKWFLPVFSALIGIYQICIGVYLVRVIPAPGDIEPKQSLLCGVCMAAVFFFSFLFSRYSIGMSVQQQWKPLRAGGSISVSAAWISLLLAISLGFSQYKILLPIHVMGWAVRILLIVLGTETALNFIFDIYRPRLKGQYSRSAFDSRLLGSISEPGGIFHTVSSAIDYQFGFKVSQTWFYRLLEKAIVPLILLSAATLYLLSCIVVVEPYEQAIVEHFGNPLTETGEKRVLEPGLSFKWPWPIDIAYKHPTEKIYELNIGYVPDVDSEGKVMHKDKLWGKAHYAKEYSLLVASKAAAGGEDEGAAPVSLVVAAVPVQYKVKDLYSYLYKHAEPARVLEGICYRELTEFAASATIETDRGEESESLLGGGRLEAKETLTEEIQRAADDAGLGVDIVFVGLQGLHPPTEVAPDYQKVVGAVQRKEAIMLNAEAERNKILSELAGSIGEANALYSLAAEYQLAKENNETEKAAELAERLDRGFAEAKGRIFETLRAAQSYAFEKEELARATGERFASQVKAYRAAKEIYVQEQRLKVLEDSLKGVRKFIVVPDKDDSLVLEMDVKEKVTPGLYDLGVVGEIGR